MLCRSSIRQIKTMTSSFKRTERMFRRGGSLRVERWSNRLRVTELWIDDAYRRQGIGTALMDMAVKRARDEKRRAIMLETQSRNENAIAFYLTYGFKLIGFNACEYQNDDLQRKDVRMELGMFSSTMYEAFVPRVHPWGHTRG